MFQALPLESTRSLTILEGDHGSRGFGLNKVERSTPRTCRWVT